MMDLQTAFDRGFEAVKAYIDAELETLAARLAALEALPPELAEQVAIAKYMIAQPATELPAPDESDARS